MIFQYHFKSWSKISGTYSERKK